MYWRALSELVCSHVACAQTSVLLASPFIKTATLREICDHLPPSASLTVYTRWRPEEVAKGVSDTAVLDLVQSRGGTLWLNDALHAKLYLVDGVSALIGSANVTAAGLGISRRANLEILVPSQLEPAISASFLADLERNRVVATAELAKAVEAAAALIPHASLPLDPDADEPAALDERHQWFPRFRSPDRLYALYHDLEWREHARAGDPAVEDLIDLALPFGLTRSAFNDLVRQRLLATPLVRKIDEAIAQPQRFGALTDLLRGAAPVLDHAQRQALAQLVIRWLLYFAGDRYRLETPNHSEVLSLR